MSGSIVVSIIIPTHNRAQYLADAIASVTDQTYPHIELIVVDDASDPPVELPSDIKAKLLRNARNMGPGASRNMGLAHASGEFLLFLDDDDLLTPGRIALAVEEMGSARGHVAAVETFTQDGRTQSGFRKFQGDLRSTYLIIHPAIGQVVHRREDVLQFDPTLRVSQDKEWWIRMSDRAIFEWSDDIGLRIRRHDSERSGVDSGLRYRTRLEIYRRYKAILSRPARSNIKRNIASAAFIAGFRFRAAMWSMQSLVDQPNVRALQLLAKSLALRPR